MGTCKSCEVQAKREAGEPVTQQELNHWMLWGCTCSEAAAEEAQAHMDRMTR